MSKSGGDAIGQILLAIFGVFVLLFSFIVLAIETGIRNSKQKARTEALRQKARSIGLDFVPERDASMAKQFRFLEHFGAVSGANRESCINVMTGTLDSHSVTLFDYYYITSGTGEWWWAPSWQKHSYFSLFIVDMNSDFPELTIAKEGFLSKISQAIGYRDIDFESHEFSTRYVVRSKNKKFAYDFCNAQMIDYLLDRQVIPIEVEKNALALAFEDLYDVGSIESNLRHLAKIRSLMPDYLFDGSPALTEHDVPQSEAPDNSVVLGDAESAVESDPAGQNLVQSDSIRPGWIPWYIAYLAFAAVSGLVSLRYGGGLVAVANSAFFAFAALTLVGPQKSWTRKFHITINIAYLVLPYVFVLGWALASYLGSDSPDLFLVSRSAMQIISPQFGSILFGLGLLLPIGVTILGIVWTALWVRGAR